MSATTETPKRAGTPTPRKPVRRKLTLGQRLKRDRVMLLLALPGLLYFLVFHYVPLLGNVIAFQDYQPYLGFFDSVWVGLENFTDAFADPQFWSALGNTLLIALAQLILFFPAPIALALLLNSVISDKIRRFVQSVVYLPHFVGWVLIVSIFQQLLGAAGLLPNVLEAVGLPRYDMMTDPGAFPWLLTIQLVWKDMGWGTIIFLAALLAIDQQLYEAAAVDGAGRWRRLWHVTLPGITPIIILLFILNLGSILSVGFEQILLQRDNVGAESGEVLDTYIFFNGIQNGEWGPSAAIGIVKAVVGTALLLGANKIAHYFGHEGIYRGADK
ncbi:polysaccharide ABC transporter ATP-binding protein [Actinorhabdospora filicis]|uniref:Polysaccharide ABC transporter ATP-binding protein n=1 Tax=Actinorhabdospora filicis TaxID=1785913 RepID=A0A9W6STJ0_9ACTN|nr:ABC transporter permease subunit [Actinorhabdospora filicis]GLZ81699.1 polysaccharide ABC transporter ATP-binding protein [Actinorhabdospora filicis]